jgi:hypothetical protein
MQDEMLADFSLAGGTALALYLGHRKSIDLDLFSTGQFDALELESHMIEKYNFRTSLKFNVNTLKGTVNDVKIDCIAHKYACMEPVYKTGAGIRLYSMTDIAAMKMAVISDNGTRLKDFIDIACLSTRMSFSDMVNAYTGKYPNTNPIAPYKGITYFAEINFKEKIAMIGGKYEWNLIEKRLKDMLNNPKNIYKSMPLRL